MTLLKLLVLRLELLVLLLVLLRVDGGGLNRLSVGCRRLLCTTTATTTTSSRHAYVLRRIHRCDARYLADLMLLLCDHCLGAEISASGVREPVVDLHETQTRRGGEKVFVLLRWVGSVLVCLKPSS